jgi:hypothetical protein
MQAAMMPTQSRHCGITATATVYPYKPPVPKLLPPPAGLSRPSTSSTRSFSNARWGKLPRITVWMWRPSSTTPSGSTGRL